MPANYNHYQTENNLPENNRCGGYALDANLYDMGRIDVPSPIETYNGIQHEQEIIVTDAASQELLNATFLSQTNISFPSAIVRYAHVSYDILPEVNVDNARLDGLALNEVITAEIQRLQDENVAIQSDAFNNILNTHQHHLLLVNDGGHWISVVNENGNLFFYDPGENGNFIATDIHYLEEIYSGVVISLD